MGVVGLAENKANSAPIELELELGLSLATWTITGWESCQWGNRFLQIFFALDEHEGGHGGQISRE